MGAIPIEYTHIKGGVEAAIINLIEGFSKQKNIEIMLVSFSKEIKEYRMINFSEHIKFHFIPFIYPKSELLDFFFNKYKLNKIINEFKPDIIHIQGAAPHLLRFVFFDKQNVIVTQHGIMAVEYKHVIGLKNRLKFLFKTVIEKFYFPRFKNIIFISDYNKKLFPRKPQNEVIIQNPVNAIFLNTKPRSDLNNSIAYVAKISKLKNIKILIEALNILKAKSIIFNVHVVGDFVEKKYKTHVMALISKYDLSKQIKFYGWLNQSQLKPVLFECTYFVLPSKQENVPVSIAESMAMGKVVIASDVGGISEMFQDGVSGLLIDPGNPKLLADKLEYLYANKTKAQEISSNAALEASEKFNSKLIAKKTLDFYNKVLQSNS